MQARRDFPYCGPKTSKLFNRNNQSAQLAQHDDYVQQLLDTLKQEDIEENTMVMWVSDNGPMYNNLWAVVPFQRMIGSHMQKIRKYPHRDICSGLFSE